MNQEYFSPTSAAKKLGVSRRTIYHWMSRNSLPYHITPSGRRLIRITDVLKNESTLSTDLSEMQ